VHETSTLRQSQTFISIDFTFGVGDYIREVTNPAQFGSDPMSSRDATALQQCYSPCTRKPIFAHNSLKDAVWCKENPSDDDKYVVVKCGVLYPKIKKSVD